MEAEMHTLSILSETTKVTPPHIDEILDAVREDMLSSGWRPVRVEDIQRGTDIVRVEVQRFYMRKNLDFKLGESGTEMCNICDIHFRTGIILLEVFGEPERGLLTIEKKDFVLDGEFPEIGKNDIRYFVRD